MFLSAVKVLAYLNMLRHGKAKHNVSSYWVDSSYSIFFEIVELQSS